MKDLPLWLDDPDPPAIRATPPPRSACDVVIVGGGVAGCTLARDLAGQGLDVVLLEAGRLAGRASGRNAGFVSSSLAEPYSSVAEKAGRSTARVLWEVQERSRERLAALVRSLGVECDFARPGSYACASDRVEGVALRASASMLRSDGFDARFLEPGEAEALLGPAGRHGVLHRSGDAQVHPAGLVQGLAAAAEQGGVRIHERAEVTRLERDGAVWLARGSGFLLRAEQIVVATNARAPQLHPWFASRLEPMRGQMLATAPTSRLKLPGIVWAQRGYQYWRAHRGRLVFGGARPVAADAERGLEETIHPRVQAALDAFVEQYLPGLHPVVTHRWAGIMDFSADGLPFVGPLPDARGSGLFTQAGFTGHGLGWVFETSRWLAALLLRDRDDVPPPLRSERAPNPALKPPA